MTEWSREQRYRRIEDVNKDELEANRTIKLSSTLSYST